MKETAIEPELLVRIFNYISTHPGLTLSTLAKHLDLKISLLEYQLSRLEQRGDIFVAQENGSIRYYPEKQNNQEIENSRADTRQKIYDLITQQPGLHISKIINQPLILTFNSQQFGHISVHREAFIASSSF